MKKKINNPAIVGAFILCMLIVVVISTLTSTLKYLCAIIIAFNIMLLMYKNIVFAFSFFLWMLVLQQAILQYCSERVTVTLISNIDEMLGIVLFFVILYKLYHGHLRLIGAERMIIYSHVFFVVLGLISNIFTQIQPFNLAVLDAYICSKYLIYYLGIRALFYHKIKVDFLFIYFNNMSRIFAAVFFVMSINELIGIPLFEQGEFRYFLYSIKLLFPHPSYLAAACAVCVFILAANMKYSRLNIWFILMLAIVMTLTLRSKAIASISIILIIYIAVFKLKIRSKLFLIGSGMLCGIYIGYDQLLYYYGEVRFGFARALLMFDSIKLAKEYFPLGTGFGTFGSFVAAENYSALYYKLGYSEMIGMSLSNSGFLTDTFWPIIIAQTGFLGLLSFFNIWIQFFRICFQIAKIDSYSFWAILSILLYELISSTSEPAMFNPSTLPMFAIAGVIVTQCYFTKGNK